MTRTFTPNRLAAAAAVALSSLAVLLLTTWLGAGQSAWFDESYSVNLAMRPLGEVLALTAVDVHPPLYYVALKAWGTLVGWDLPLLRLSTSLTAAATVPTLYAVARQLFSSRVALATLPFITVSPMLLRYGYELRMQALVTLIGALGTLALVQAVRGNAARRSSRRRRMLWAAYALLVAAGMYTFYLSAALWLAHLMWLVHMTRTDGHSASAAGMLRHGSPEVPSKKQRTPFWRLPWVRAYAVAIVLFVPYLPVVLSQTRLSGEASSLSGIGRALTAEVLLNSITMALAYTPVWQVGAGLTLVFVVWAVSLVAVSRQVPMSGSERSGLRLLMLLTVVPLSVYLLQGVCAALGQVVGVGHSAALFVPRYMTSSVIYAFVIVGVLCALSWSRHDAALRWLSITVAVTTLTLQSVGLVRLGAEGNYNYDTLSQYRLIEARETVDCSPEDTVVADGPQQYLNLWYHFSDCDLRFFSAEPVWRQGGYALLGDQQGESLRISSAAEVATPQLTVLSDSDHPSAFTPDDRYRFVQSQQVGSLMIARYEVQPAESAVIGGR